jgi:O-antigen ligase
LLLFTIPFSVEYNVRGGLSTDLPDEPFMWALSFLVLAGLVQKGSGFRQGVSHPLVLLLLLGWCWTLVTVIFSTDPLLSLKFWLAKGWYLLAFVVAPLLWLRDPRNLVRAVYLLAGSMALLAVWALWKHGQSGFRFDRVNEAVAPFFRNHVNYSALLVLTIPLWVLLLGGRHRRWGWLLLPLLLAALYFSYARGAWLAGLAGLAAWWLIRQGWLLRAYVLGLVLVMAAFLWLRQEDRYLQYAHDFRTTIYHKELTEHLLATYKGKDVSTAERFYRWIAAIRMSTDRPLTGTGPNLFPEAYKPWAVPAFRTWVSDNPERSTVHNYFLLLLVEQGWPGLLLWVLLLGAGFYYAQRLYREVRDRFYRKLALLLGVWLVMLTVLNFLSDLVETDKVGSVFYLTFAGLLLADYHRQRNLQTTPHIEGIPETIPQ